MSEFWRTVLLFLCGGGGLAIINIIQERWRFKAERNAKKEDRNEEKSDKIEELGKKFDSYIKEQRTFNEGIEARQKEMDEQMSVQSEALKLILLDRVLYLGQSYINQGSVNFDDRKRLRDMHNVYHKGLHGNGDADFIMNAVDELPLAR